MREAALRRGCCSRPGEHYECEALYKEWHDTSEGRIRLALAPRFILSCTEGLLRDADALARKWGVLVHTHASENRDEVRWVQQRTGCGNIEAFDRYGMLHSRLSWHTASGPVRANDVCCVRRSPSVALSQLEPEAGIWHSTCLESTPGGRFNLSGCRWRRLQ